jgi:CDP-diacylglycerol--glycerol-3-phosphate 3-phosphatidyltransferase
MAMPARRGPRAVTKANYVGISRIVLWTPLAVVCTLADWQVGAFVAIVMCGVSDVLDGTIARRENTLSQFGVFLDLTADKVFVASMLVCFVYKGFVPMWVVIAILVREFLVMGLRCYAAAEQVIISADLLGGLKIITTFVAFLAITLHLGLGFWLLMVATTLTIVSGVAYFYRARALLLKSLYYTAVPADR